MIEQVKKKVAELRPELVALSEYIYHHPELGHKEYLSSQAHVDWLEKYQFVVEKPYLGFETAFRATYTSDKPGPTIAFLAEYDALPEIGHGCGHNLLGATMSGAGIILRQMVDELGGRVVVLGTPAEETCGVKVDMAARGTFADIDVAICVHPEQAYYESGTSMAMHAVEFDFHGQAAHAAAAPFKGRNALDGVVHLYQAVALQRQQMHPNARIHGIISQGGEAANVIPDFAQAQFYIRAPEMGYLEELYQRLLTMAQAAAQATGTQVEWRFYEKSYKNLVTNRQLSRHFNQVMSQLGITMVPRKEGEIGSLDMGDVSQVVPAINPYFKILPGQEAYSLHTPEFREATLTDYAIDQAGHMIAGVVLTACDVIKDSHLLKAIKQEFESTFKA